MKSFLSVKVKYCPMKKLALIPFENNPDKLYKCLELQYFDSEISGRGYRIVAYRNDNYLDVYDDYSLVYDKDEKFNIAENGLNKHIQTTLDNTIFQTEDGKLTLSFTFNDIENREISFFIKEEINSKTKPMNLLAPVGFGSKNPEFMPLLFLYDFDFIRRKDTIVRCKIDNIDVEIDTFPMLMNFQRRYFTRYSENCELIEFINTDYSELEEVNLDNKLVFQKDNVAYRFEKENALKEILIMCKENETIIKFAPPLNITETMSGKFNIEPKSIYGHINGEFSVNRKEDIVEFNLRATDGWVPVPNSLISKILFSKNSIFCRWTRNYDFKEVINLKTMETEGKWINNN